MLGEVTSRASPRHMTRQAAKRKMALLQDSFTLVITLWFSAFWTVQVSAKQPNFLIVLADDLGYGDLGCFGQKVIQTPNINRLAAEGMKLTDHYAGHTVCRPSRLVLWTGQHVGHTGLTGNRPRSLNRH